MNCIPLEQLLKEWEVDAKIDTLNPQKEMIRIPVLHAKYVSQITAHSISLKMKRFKFLKHKQLKIEYYSGKMGDAQLKELGWKPFQLLVMKADLNSYLDSDDDLIGLSEKMIANEEAVTFCTAVCKELNSRTFQLREYMAWEKFIAGQN